MKTLNEAIKRFRKTHRWINDIGLCNIDSKGRPNRKTDEEDIEELITEIWIAARKAKDKEEEVYYSEEFIPIPGGEKVIRKITANGQEVKSEIIDKPFTTIDLSFITPPHDKTE